MNETFMEPITDADKIPKQRWKLVRYFLGRISLLDDSLLHRNVRCVTYGKAHAYNVANLLAFSRFMRPALGRRGSSCL